MKEKFRFLESSNSFIGRIEVGGKLLEIELKLAEAQLNWPEIEEFISKLDGDKFVKMVSVSTQLLLGFVKLVPFGLEEPYDQYEFKMEAVVYYGKVNNFVFGRLVDGYALIFKIYHPGYIECYDPYGNYIVDVASELITGIRREQG